MDLPCIRPIIPVKRFAFDDPRWIFEPKYDGFRGLLYKQGDTIEFRSKHNKLMMPRFQAFAKDLHSELVPNTVILDGEIVSLDPESGYSDISHLRRGTLPLVYVAFDLLWLNKLNYTGMPLDERKRMLTRVVRMHRRTIQITQFMHAYGHAALFLAESSGWEGLIAKKQSDIYTSSTRWYKILNPVYRTGTKKPKR